MAKQCGGCRLQAVSYEYQLKLKEDRVRQDLIRIGGFAPEEIDRVLKPIMGMDTIEGGLPADPEVKQGFRYRNKAQFPVGEDEQGEPVIGFYASRSHRIVPVEDCLLGHPVNQKITSCVKAYMKRFHVPAYDEITGKGLVRHILTRVGFHTGEIMVCLVINGEMLPEKEALINLLTEIPGMTSISVNSNTRNTNVIMGQITKTIWGSETITDEIGGVKFRISPRSFYQVNPYQTERLYHKALEYADLHGSETVWDLYCGIGTISLFLAGKAKKVCGVEVIPEAIGDARKNAALNGIDNAVFLVGKAEEVLPEFYYGSGSSVGAAASEKGMPTPDVEKGMSAPDAEKGMRTPDVIVVDPPRKGCDEKCLSTMLAMKPARIVYVSCDPATLARDLKLLCQGGYELREITPCDQFGQTNHVESCVLLERVSNRKADSYVKLNVKMADYYRIKDSAETENAEE